MKKRYGIYCALHGESSAFTRALVKEIAVRFDLQYTLRQNLDPHFTLKYFFETDDIVPLEKLTRQFCDVHPKSPVRIGGFESFPPHVFFLGVGLSGIAQQTFEDYIRLLRALPWMQWDQYDHPGLHFHVTFAEKCGDKYESVKEFLRGKEIYFDTLFDNITILYQSGVENGIEKWTVHRSFKMK